MLICFFAGEKVFEQQTPVPDRAAPDDVLPRLVAKLSSNEQLESSEWRRLIRLSDDTRRKGAAVWGPWMEEVVQGVAEVWRRVSLERKEKGTNTVGLFVWRAKKLQLLTERNTKPTEGTSGRGHFPDLFLLAPRDESNGVASIDALFDDHHRLFLRGLR